MEYLQSLSDYLIENIVDKDKLDAWAEDGDLAYSPHASEGGYEITYKANFEMSDVEVDPPRLFMLLSNWILHFVPEREAQGLANPEFFVERLANGRYDIGVKLDFIEQFTLVEDIDGGWLIGAKHYRLQSDIQTPFDTNAHGELLIFDSHKQDNGMTG